MKRNAVLVALLGALVIGCAPERGGQGLTYVPPARLPPTTGAAFVPAPPERVLDQLAERLPQAGLDVRRTEPAQGLLVALYAGDPEPYVDCGWIVPAAGVGPGGRQEQLAAQHRASFTRPFGAQAAVFERGLQLNARLVATVTPTAGGSLIDTTAAYVLTKSVEVVGATGPLGQGRETISFSTGNSAEFAAGTVCQPNGRLEALALENATAGVVAAEPAADPPPELAARIQDVVAGFACPDVEVTFGAGNAILVSGYVADPFSQAELPRQLQRLPGIGPVEARLAVQRPEFCQALEIVAPYSPDNGYPGGAAPLAVRVVTADGTAVLRANEPVVLELTLPTPDAYVQVDRIEPNGRVTHLAAGRATELGLPRGTTSFRYTTAHRAQPPFGREMILAFASAEPLFRAARPATEPADTYLPELHSRIDELRTHGAPLAATYTVVTTQRAAGA